MASALCLCHLKRCFARLLDDRSVPSVQFNQVSFCNSISTSKGGTHVNYVADGIVKYLMEAIKKKHKIK